MIHTLQCRLFGRQSCFLSLRWRGCSPRCGIGRTFLWFDKFNRCFCHTQKIFLAWPDLFWHNYLVTWPTTEVYRRVNGLKLLIHTKASPRKSSRGGSCFKDRGKSILQNTEHSRISIAPLTLIPLEHASIISICGSIHMIQLDIPYYSRRD